MRSPTAASLVSWPASIFKPWLVASVFGLGLGFALLSVDSVEPPSSYTEPASRAAVYEEPIAAPVVLPSVAATFVPEPPIAPLAGLVEGAASALPPELE